MKAIKLLIIAILIGSTVMPFIPANLKAQTSFSLQAKKNIPSKELLESSAKVISGRIKDYTGNKPTYELNVSEGKISFKIEGEWNRDMIGQLVLRKGEMNIYEVPDRNRILKMIPAEGLLHQCLQEDTVLDSNSPSILCTDKEKMEAIRSELLSVTLPVEVQWAWEMHGHAGYCLYALHIKNGTSPVFGSNPVEAARIMEDQKKGSGWIEMVFHKQASGQWAEATRRNINQHLAMVIDQEVVCVPMVRAAITGGRSIIAGDFSDSELKFMKALLNNGVLPLEFQIAE